VREAIGGLIPSAGVGSAFARNAFEEIASAHEQKPFNVESLTEDYEIAIKFRLANKRVHFACRTLERPAEPDGSLGTGEEYLATREYFPSGFGASVRQRSRWLCGITLQTWQQVGWQGSLPVLYCLWRDRKAVVMNLVVLLAYALVLQLAMMAALAPLMHSDWNLQHVVPTGSLLSLLLSANACALLWRAGLKAYFVGRLYGPVQALLSAPRLIAGNAISVLATLRALRQYATYRITGEPLRWLKTAHVFPNARTLRARARMLGECLLESGLISAEELSQALLLQRGTNLQLGAVLTLSGLVSGNTVTGVLSEQWGIEPSFQIDPRSIPLELLRTLSEHDAERLDVLPLSSTDKEVSIAVARQLPLHERTQLEGLLGAPVRPCLVDRELLQRARQKAYRRLVSAPVLQPLAADGRAPLLGERLVAAGQLSQSDLERALTEQTESGELLGELLDRRGFVTASGVAEGLQLWSSAAPLEQTALDRDAMAKLGFAFCALYSILPLASASGARRFLASPFPLPDAVITRANAELSESLEFAYAPLFQVRAGLARAQREQRVTPDSELAGVPALDRCEIRAITSLGAFRGSTRELWQRCSADALAPVEYLEAAGLVTQAEAAGLRSETYRIELDSDVAPQPPPTAAASLLPPSWLQRHDIRVVQATAHSAVLATAKPSPELARLVARCLPTWAIEWRVAGPPLSAACSEPRPRKSWNNNRTIN
jgi:hypothetical protein